MTTRIHDAVPHAMPHVVLPGNRVRQSNEVAQVGGPRKDEREDAVVEVIKEGEVVQAIDVTCRCGHKTRVWCVYEPE